MKTSIDSERAPTAIGPYSQAVQVGCTLFVSGQLPIDPTTGEFPNDTIQSQVKQCLDNLVAILEEAGYQASDVTMVKVYLDDIYNFAEMNEIYSEYFSAPYPARAAFEVSRLPKNALVEIEAVAVK